MIPEFLKKYEKKLEKFKLESIRINANPLEDDEVLQITESKFLGKPYLPGNFEYPKDKNGRPLILIAQINFEEVPALENYPDSGILQFYIPPTDWQYMEGYKIIYHENISEQYQTDFSFLTEDLYEESPVHCEHKLEFEKIIEYGGFTDFRFMSRLQVKGKDFADFFEEDLDESQQEEVREIISGEGHKIGGYAYFTQEDPRWEDKKIAKHVLLLQIDTDDEIMFGDTGVGSLFIHPADLASKKFEKAWFYWDCR